MSGPFARRGYGHVHRRAAPEPVDPCLGQGGWDVATVTIEDDVAIVVSEDRRDLTNPSYQDFNGASSLPRCEGSTKVYLEVQFLPDGDNARLFPAYIGLISPEFMLAPPAEAGRVIPESADVAFAMLVGSNGDTEYYVEGAGAGFYPEWGFGVPGDDPFTLMLAWDVETGRVDVGQGGCWIGIPPSEALEFAQFIVSGTDMVAYAWNVVLTRGAFTAADLAYPIPIGYTAWDGSGASDETSYTGDPMTIPDDDMVGVSDSVTVIESGILSDGYLDIAITHPRLEDLIVTLTHGAETLTVLNQVPGVNYSARINLTYDFFADIQGEWTLTARDVVSGETGTVDSWSLTVLPR